MTNEPMPPVGTIARRSRTLTLNDIARFTEITGDHNPLHYDESLASASRFGGIIVQGGVTSGLFNAIVAEDLPGPGTVFLQVNWGLRAPGRPGDTITAEVEVLDRRADKPIATLRTTITNQHGETLIDGTAVVYRDPSIASRRPDRVSPPPPDRSHCGTCHTRPIQWIADGHPHRDPISGQTTTENTSTKRSNHVHHTTNRTTSARLDRPQRSSTRAALWHHRRRPRRSGARPVSLHCREYLD